MGLKYYDDMQVKIPREEVARIAAVVQEATAAAVAELGANAPTGELHCIPCGSYRRGKPQSGDVDMIVSHAAWDDGLLEKILEKLRELFPGAQPHLRGPARPRLLLRSFRGPDAEAARWRPRAGFISDELTAVGGFDKKKKKGLGEVTVQHSWMGLVRLPGAQYHRRLDIKVRAGTNPASQLPQRAVPPACSAPCHRRGEARTDTSRL